MLILIKFTYLNSFWRNTFLSSIFNSTILRLTQLSPSLFLIKLPHECVSISLFGFPSLSRLVPQVPQVRSGSVLPVIWSSNISSDTIQSPVNFLYSWRFYTKKQGVLFWKHFWASNHKIFLLLEKWMQIFGITFQKDQKCFQWSTLCFFA